MKSSSFLWMVVLLAFLLFCFDGITRAEEKPQASVTVYGHLNALSNLRIKSVEIPWSPDLALGKIINNLGGYDDYAYGVEIESPGMDILRYKIGRSLNDKSLPVRVLPLMVMEMKLTPGAKVHVIHIE